MRPLRFHQRVLLLGSFLSFAALAQPSDNGRLLASNCFQCHGTNGTNGGFDTLAGQSQADLLHKLEDFRLKAAGSNIMNPHARGYTSSDLYWITYYFSKLPKP
jgi:cytochrome subunit of sulfide dehydrogenase